jgi:hypothetical protein
MEVDDGHTFSAIFVRDVELAYVRTLGSLFVVSNPPGF